MCPADQNLRRLLILLLWVSAGPVLRVSGQQAGRGSDDGLVALPRWGNLLFSHLTDVRPALMVLVPAGMIEHGLVDSSSYRPKSSLSEDASLEDSVSGAEEFVSVSASDLDQSPPQPEVSGRPPAEKCWSGTGPDRDRRLLRPPSRTSPESGDSDWETLDPSVLEEGGAKEAAEEDQSDAAFAASPETAITVQPQAVSGQGGVVQGLVSGLEEDQYGLPLPIFTKVCLPPP